MTVEAIQICDRCKKTRPISLVGALFDNKTKDNWRVIPADTQFGPARSEQPCLCPDCCLMVLHYILSGPKTVIHVPTRDE